MTANLKRYCRPRTLAFSGASIHDNTSLFGHFPFGKIPFFSISANRTIDKSINHCLTVLPSYAAAIIHLATERQIYERHGGGEKCLVSI